MPNRELREGFLSSEALATLTADEERLYVRLLLCADDFGRFEAKPTLVKSRAFPLADEMTGITVKSVTNWLQSLASKGLIHLYEVNGKAYVQIEKWRQRMRANASKFPPPPDEREQMPDKCPTNDGQMPVNSPADDGHLQASRARAPIEDRGSRIEDRITRSEERGVRKRTARAPETPIPEDFGISDGVRQWFGRSPYSAESLDEHFAAFALKARAKAYRYADWDSAFMEAVRADWAKLRGRSSGGARDSPSRMSLAAQTAAGFGSGASRRPMADVIDIEPGRVYATGLD